MQDKIRRSAELMEIALPDGAAEKMAAYWHAVLVANESLNLTRITDEDEACAAHFMDSLAPLQYGTDMIPKGASLIDVGTGAGFPGIPLALARPDLRVTLLDARQKRLAFIDETARALGIANARISHARAEDHRERYDVVCARAVAALSKLVGLTAPLIAPGGLAILWKGPSVEAELSESATKCTELECVLLEPVRYDLPCTDRKHRLVLVEKGKDTGQAVSKSANLAKTRDIPRKTKH